MRVWQSITSASSSRSRRKGIRRPSEFYPPSGPCGWQWDGLSQSWYYNGDCDQEVLSITSIAARGADTFVTMNDGTVFAPGPLGQLHLSYLVPAVDGTYLGVGAAAGAMAARGASTGADTASLALPQ